MFWIKTPGLSIYIKDLVLLLPFLSGPHLSNQASISSYSLSVGRSLKTQPTLFPDSDSNSQQRSYKPSLSVLTVARTERKDIYASFTPHSAARTIHSVNNNMHTKSGLSFYIVLVCLAPVICSYGQHRGDIPSCALPCLDDSIKMNTKCDITDISCVCKSFIAIQGDATSCFITACGADVALTKALPATKQLCKNPAVGGIRP